MAVPYFKLVSEPAAAAAVDKEPLDLGWLIRLRWMIALGLVLIVVIASGSLAMHLSPLRHLAVAGWMAVTNLLLQSFIRRRRIPSGPLLSITMCMDIGLLSLILYWTGGVENPFCSFYLVPIALAAMALQGVAMWAPIVLSLAGFVVVFFHHEDICISHVHDADMSFNLHLQGMVISNVLTGICLLYFVARLTRELRASQEKLARSRLLAVQNERFASLATLAAGVAHELNSPLGTMAIVSKELEHATQKLEAPPEVVADTRLLRTEIERCRRILDRLNLSSTRGVGDAPGEVALQDLVDQLLEKLPADTRQRLDLPRNSAESALFIPRESVVQALTTLIQNARDASPPQGRIRLEVSIQAEVVEFIVEDQGGGIPSEIRSRIGEPFFTTKQPGKGMGLGLFLVRVLAERMEGHLQFKSGEAGGTRAIFTIPRQQNS